MSAPLADIPVWQSRVVAFFVLLAIILMPVFAHAGGLGMAPVAAIIGVLGFSTLRPKRPFRVDRAYWALGLFLLWAFCSSYWSPYVQKSALTNPVKLILSVLLFLGCFTAVRRVATIDRRLPRLLIIGAACLMIVMLLIDYTTDYKLTFFVDPPNPDEDIMRKKGDAFMNTVHSVAILALLTAPVSLMIRRQFRYGMRLAAIFVLLATFVAFLSGLTIGAVAIISSVVTMFFARYYPVTTYKCIMWFAIACVVFAPLMGYFVGLIPDIIIAKLPFSWEHRIEMWAYTSDRIWEAPLWGHGFDAVRTFKATFSSRGVEDWSIVSLHTHNFGLQIWIETGLIGVMMACAFILIAFETAKTFVMSSLYRLMVLCGFMMAAILISCFTYGLWQEWWWGTFVFVMSFIWFLPAQET